MGPSVTWSTTVYSSFSHSKMRLVISSGTFVGLDDDEVITAIDGHLHTIKTIGHLEQELNY